MEWTISRSAAKRETAIAAPSGLSLETMEPSALLFCGAPACEAAEDCHVSGHSSSAVLPAVSNNLALQRITRCTRWAGVPVIQETP